MNSKEIREIITNHWDEVDSKQLSAELASIWGAVEKLERKGMTVREKWELNDKEKESQEWIKKCLEEYTCPKHKEHYSKCICLPKEKTDWEHLIGEWQINYGVELKFVQLKELKDLILTIISSCICENVAAENPECPHCFSKEPKTNWEESFDKDWGETLGTIISGHMKDLISQLLKSEREKIIETMKGEYDRGLSDGIKWEREREKLIDKIAANVEMNKWDDSITTYDAIENIRSFLKSLK